MRVGNNSYKKENGLLMRDKESSFSKGPSFLSIEKDCGILIKEFLQNKNLKKLLYYQNKECLEMPELNQEQTYSLLNKNIRTVPSIQKDKDIFSYIVISFDNFQQNETNPQFRNNNIFIDIVCHVDSWNLTNFQLRPYKIAGEIDKILNNNKLTGIGEIQFNNSKIFFIDENFVGVTLSYSIIHGKEDYADEQLFGINDRN